MLIQRGAGSEVGGRGEPQIGPNLTQLGAGSEVGGRDEPGMSRWPENASQRGPVGGLRGGVQKTMKSLCSFVNVDIVGVGIAPHQI